MDSFNDKKNKKRKRKRRRQREMKEEEEKMMMMVDKTGILEWSFTELSLHSLMVLI